MDKVIYTWGMKEEGGLQGAGWKELVFSRTHSPSCLQRLSELERVIDVFWDVSSASDNLSEPRAPRRVQ